MQTRQPFTWKNTKTNSFLLEFQAFHLIHLLFAAAFSLARSPALALSVFIRLSDEQVGVFCVVLC